MQVIANPMDWAVFMNRPRYPSLEGRYDTEAEATAAAQQLAMDEQDDGGLYECHIYVAQVSKVIGIRTHY